MTSTHTIRRRSAPTAALVVAITAAAALALPAARASAAGQPPPEWAANAGAWPAHNYDLANTRATTQTPINSQTVSRLKVKWTFAFKGASGFGAFASTPISLNGTVYLQDLNSNVYALDRTTGQVKWQHLFNKPSVGPNGVAFGDGRIYGATSTDAFALDAQTGTTLWTRKLTRNTHEGVDMTPQVFDGTVLLSTVPGNISNFYAGHGDGIVWALDAATGQVKWKFNTISDGAKLFGNPEINSGGGLWYPPSVDSQGRVFISVANPAPLYGTKKFPNGSSRPGPNLYTNSLVALDGQTGKRLWFQQAVPHDVRDYDLMIPAIVATLPIGGVDTEVVMVAGKMGKAFAYRADNGRRLWTHSRRPAPQRHRTADAQGRDDLPRRLRRGRDADGLRRRQAVRAVARPRHPGERERPGDLDQRERERLQERSRWADRHRRSHRRGGLAAQAAVDGLRGGHGRQRRRLHQRLRRHDVRLRHPGPARRCGVRRRPPGSTPSPPIDGDTLLVGSAAAGFTKKPNSSSSPTRSRKQPRKEQP